MEAIVGIEGRLESLEERLNSFNGLLDARRRELSDLELRTEEARGRLRAATQASTTKASEAWSPAIGLATAPKATTIGGDDGAEAVEWYVLARLAQQRSVSFVGSVPLVIDDAFLDWSIDLLGDVFSRLERMSAVIQILYLTEDPDVGDWARRLGPDRALVLDMRVPA